MVFPLASALTLVSFTLVVITTGLPLLDEAAVLSLSLVLATLAVTTVLVNSSRVIIDITSSLVTDCVVLMILFVVVPSVHNVVCIVVTIVIIAFGVVVVSV